MFGLARRFLQTPTRIESWESFQKLKLTTEKMLVVFFDAEFSNPAKLLGPQFSEAVKDIPNVDFRFCDIDQAPKVAYDCEVNQVPSISVIPLGRKPDNTTYDKSDWANCEANDYNYREILNDMKEKIRSYQFSSEKEDLSLRKEWRFDPATGTSRPPL